MEPKQNFSILQSSHQLCRSYGSLWPIFHMDLHFHLMLQLKMSKYRQQPRYADWVQKATGFQCWFFKQNSLQHWNSFLSRWRRQLAKTAIIELKEPYNSSLIQKQWLFSEQVSGTTASAEHDQVVYVDRYEHWSKLWRISYWLATHFVGYCYEQRNNVISFNIKR